MTYQEILNQLDAIERALSPHVLSLAIGRFGQYRREIAKLTDPDFLRNLQNLDREKRSQFFFMLSEAFELCITFETLKLRLGPALVERLRQVFGGPANAADESGRNSSNRARNIQFEVFLMAHLLKAGFPLADESLTDVRTSFRDREVLIECKRPQRSAGIHSCLGDAVRQLTQQRRNDIPNALKIVAISLSKVLTEGDLLVYAEDESAAKRAINAAVLREINPHIPYFHKRAGKRVAGIFAVASVSMVHLGSMSPATITMQVFFDNPQLAKADYSDTEAWYEEYRTRSEAA